MAVLVDTSIWIDHFRKQNLKLISLLEQNLVLIHTAIIGEIACGHMKRRTEVLEYLKYLPRCQEAMSQEVLEMIEHRSLYGKGLNWIDVNLLASAILSGGELWTKDRKLAHATSDGS